MGFLAFLFVLIALLTPLGVILGVASLSRSGRVASEVRSLRAEVSALRNAIEAPAVPTAETPPGRVESEPDHAIPAETGTVGPLSGKPETAQSEPERAAPAEIRAAEPSAEKPETVESGPSDPREPSLPTTGFPLGHGTRPLSNTKHQALKNNASSRFIIIVVSCTELVTRNLLVVACFNS